VDFMRGEPLRAGDPSGRALLAYLHSLSSSPDAARACTVVRNIDPAYLGALPPGDRGRGESMYRQACTYCHGEIHTGKGRIGPAASVLPDETIATFGAEARAIIAEKVRHGKYFGIGGRMPLYCVERLADAELSDILSYLLP
jgi:thiosulfate dehydrogenase